MDADKLTICAGLIAYAIAIALITWAITRNIPDNEQMD